VTLTKCCYEPRQPGVPLRIKYETLEMQWAGRQEVGLSSVPPNCEATSYKWKITAGPATLSPKSGYDTTVTIDTPKDFQAFTDDAVTVQLWCEKNLIGLDA